MKAEDLELLPLAVPERRRVPRPEPPPPSLAPRVRRFVDYLADRVEAGWPGRVALALVCVASVGFIVWNLTARFEELDEGYLLVREQVALQNRFDVLAAHYSRDELHDLLERISSAESSIFRNYASLAAWLAGQAVAAGQMGLELTYRMHDPVAARVRNVSEVPITLTVRPVAGREDGTYQRILVFLRDMLAARWHLEIVDVSARGDGRSIAAVDTTVHVWVDALAAGAQEAGTQGTEAPATEPWDVVPDGARES